MESDRGMLIYELLDKPSLEHAEVWDEVEVW